MKQEAWYVELSLDFILSKKSQPTVYKEVSKFPEVRRDLSLVVDKSVLFAQIEEIARKTEKNILSNVSVFDVYEGDKIENGKKAYAISFMLTDSEKTLTDEQIEKIMSRLIKAFETEIAANIRM